MNTMLKAFFVLMILALNVSFVSAQSWLSNSNSQRVGGYTKSNGTYVAPYYRTQSNATNTDNYSTNGNYNWRTGNSGTRAADYSSNAYNYGNGQTIYTGPRGGQYYINSTGNKTYVPKR